MNNIYGKNKYKKRKTIIVSIFILFFILFFFIYFNKIKLTIINIISGFYSFENIDAKDLQIIDLQKKILNLEEANNMMSTNMQMSTSTTFNFQLALPIVQENVFYNSLIVKIKDIKNIVVGDLIYTSYSHPVGIIENIENNIAKIKLFSFSDFAFVIVLQDNITMEYYETGATGDGMYGIIAYINRDKDVSIGQKVFYKNNKEKEIGYISKIEDIEKENIKKLYIKTYYKDHQDSYLFVKE